MNREGAVYSDGPFDDAVEWNWCREVTISSRAPFGGVKTLAEHSFKYRVLTTFLMTTLFMSTAPVDEDALLELVNDDTEFLETLINTFLADCTEYVEGIRRAVDDEDARTLVEEAHRLKGAVANLQARPARQAAQRMEEIGRSEAFEEAPEALEQLQIRIDHLRDTLEEIVRNLE